MGTELKIEALQKAPTAQTPLSETAPQKTRGEVLFDRFVYAGLGGVGTFILTLPLAYWAEYKGGKKAFEKIADKASGIMPHDAAKKVAETTALGLGGTVMLLPVWVAEHYRKPIVHKLNDWFGSGADQQSEIQKAPDQSVGSLLLGRATAWTAVYAGFVGFSRLAKAMGNENALEDFKVWTGNKLSNVFNQATHIAGEETRFYRYGKLAALDVFATAAATSILYVGSRFFARREAEKSPHSVTKLDEAATPQISLANAVEPVQKDSPATTITGEKQQVGAVESRAPEAAVQLS